MLVDDKTEIDDFFAERNLVIGNNIEGCAGGTKKFISPDARKQQQQRVKK